MMCIKLMYNRWKAVAMNNKIIVKIYGIESQVLGGGCSSRGCGGCSSKAESGHKCCGDGNERSSKGCSGGCGSEGGCSSKKPKSIIELYNELVQTIELSDVKDWVELEFLDIRKINILDNENIRMLYDRDYELPYCVIDGIVRYYGGIPNSLIYNDIKELLSE